MIRTTGGRQRVCLQFNMIEWPSLRSFSTLNAYSYVVFCEYIASYIARYLKLIWVACGTCTSNARSLVKSSRSVSHPGHTCDLL